MHPDGMLSRKSPFDWFDRLTNLIRDLVDNKVRNRSSTTDKGRKYEQAYAHSRMG